MRLKGPDGFYPTPGGLWVGVWLTCVTLAGGLPEMIRIGGLFGNKDDPTVEKAFLYGIYKVNQQRHLLRHSKITYDIQHLPTDNSFVAAKKACNQAGLGVAAIFGPQSSQISRHINSMCNTLEVPHVESRLEPRRDFSQLFSINLYPDAARISRAYLQLLKHFRWKKFVIVYEKESDLLLLQDIIKAPLSREVEISVRQATKDNLRETLKELEKSGVRHFMAHMHIDMSHQFLLAALQLGMINSKHFYIVTNLDLQTLDTELFRYNNVNLTGFRLVTEDNPVAEEVFKQMELYERYTGAKLLNATKKINTEAALMYDAVYVLVHALHHADKSTRIRLVNLTCEGDQAWAYGSTLYNYLNLVKMDGLTGPIRFDRGRRVDFKLDVLQLSTKGLDIMGTWSPTDGLNLTVKGRDTETGEVQMPNKTLIITSIMNKQYVTVTTILEKPYTMLKKKGDGEPEPTGNDRFEGFCVDLLKQIAEEIDFKYKIKLVSDGLYGSEDPETKVWNGMVKEIRDGTADLAVAPLTINFKREQVIDFTKPFMNLGISILFKRPKRESPGLFSFLNPLAIEIWVYVVAAYVVVSLVMFVLARFSPYEWYNPHPCNPDTDIVENQFSLINSFWFAVGTLMQQGSDINPRAVSTRILGGIWWFFTLIIISSYTANLAAFLTVERMVSPIESAEDLAKQTKIKYGTIEGGSTMSFFRDSRFDLYKRMWMFMESQKPSVFEKSSPDGIKRVKNGDYAFFMESTMIDYNIQRNCDLMQVGGLLDTKGYGVGTPIDSPWRDRISMTILNLQENGKIQLLYNKWWRNTGTCHHDDKKQESKALGLQNVGGIFVVLITGLILAVIVSVVEFALNSRKNAAADKQSLCSEMSEEFRFAIRCNGSTTRPAFKRKCSRCATTHIPGQCTIDSPNGVIHLRDMRRSPVTRRDSRRSSLRGSRFHHYHDCRDELAASHQHLHQPQQQQQDNPYNTEYRDIHVHS